MDEEKKVALITGGTSGIGLAAARLFLDRNWRVALIGRSAARGAAALRSLAAAAADSAFFSGDVASPEQCGRLTEEAAARFGCIDALVNSAGVYLERAIDAMTEADYDAIMNCNVKGTYFMCRDAAQYLKRRPGSAIVNVSSDAGLNGNYFCTAYCASKGAVTVFTKALALELAPYGVRVNCVCPGDIDTPLTEAQLSAAPDRAAAQREMRALYPLGRIGTAEEVAAVIYFLASAQASFVTGAAWSVDGGITAC